MIGREMKLKLNRKEKKTSKTKQFNFNMSEWFIILLLQDKPGLRLKEDI